MINKFEIPLTIIDTEKVFYNITNSILSSYINSVFAPAFHKHSGSARIFTYKQDEKTYHNILQRVNEIKPVILTIPSGNVETIDFYIKLGIKKFMISKWNNELSRVKASHQSVEIYRSIVGNIFNNDIEDEFDKVVIPYFKLLDIEWIKEASKRVKLIALVNHFCKVQCPNLEEHSKVCISHKYGDVMPKFICNPEGTNFFLPRENLEMVLPYIDQVKLVEREISPLFYESYIMYYISKGKLNIEGVSGSFFIDNFEFNNRKIEKYLTSNLQTGNCKFKCSICTAKCF